MTAFGVSFLGAHNGGRPRGRRRAALFGSLLVHAGALATLVVVRSAGGEPRPQPAPVLVLVRLTQPRARPGRPAPPPEPRSQPERRARRPPLTQPPPERVPASPPEQPPEDEPDLASPEEPTAGEGDEVPAPAPPGPPGGAGGAGQDQVLELRQVARPPAVREQVTPAYPREARWQRIEGRVVVRVIVGRDGRVEAGSARVVRSLAALDEAALAAIARWRFSPAIGHDGRPVRVVIEVPFQFTLR